MEAGFVVLMIVIVFVLGCLVGMLISKLLRGRDETQGVIYAYYGESNNGPSLLLNQSVPIDEIASRKRVMFDVIIVK